MYFIVQLALGCIKIAVIARSPNCSNYEQIGFSAEKLLTGVSVPVVWSLLASKSPYLQAFIMKLFFPHFFKCKNLHNLGGILYLRVD